MISLEAEKIFEIFGFSVTNTILTSWLAIIFLSFIFFRLNKNLSKFPSKFQLIFEIIFENLQSFLRSILNEHLSPRILAFILTFFIFILFSNWLGVFPGVGSIYLQKDHHHIPLFRSPYSDLNMTLTLALISVIGTNLLGIYHLGNNFLKRYLNPVGVLEIFGELAKILSFSFRLFGNIFAGEVLLTVVFKLFAFIFPIPFIGLEMFVGLIQAVIFTVLTTIFLKVALSEEH